jgi:hypothetical protein
MPINIVTIIPPGSLPGMMNFAIAPNDEADDKHPEEVHKCSRLVVCWLSLGLPAVSGYCKPVASRAAIADRRLLLAQKFMQQPLRRKRTQDNRGSRGLASSGDELTDGSLNVFKG